MKTLVTGGAGFIGSQVADALIDQQHKVTIVDNLNTGKRENINSQARFVELDLKRHQEIRQLVVREKFEMIFHLAAQMDVRKSVADPVADAEDNIIATLNLLEAAKEAQAVEPGSFKKFIFSSTGGATYGETEDRPTPEGHAANPLSPYGVGKLTVDKYLHFYQQTHGLDYISLRYSNVYGPRQNPHGEAGVVAIFLDRMFKGEQPVINGDGEQTRDYVFVEDVVRANLLALEKETVTGILNVGTSVETSVNELFHELNHQFDDSFEEQHGPALPGEQRTSCLAVGKIKEELGWEPKVNLSEGVKRTWEWFSQQASAK